MALAVHLALHGRKVTVARTGRDDVDRQTVAVTINGGQGRVFQSPIETVSLARLSEMAGTVVVASKAYANRAIASTLSRMAIAAPVVILQNGLGVEKPFLDLDALHLYRCVLYVAGQASEGQHYSFAPITASPVGVVRGNDGELALLVDRLNTAEFPFRTQGNIQQEVWKKAIVNAVFNSICPLLEIDNGIFVRDEKAARLAREVVVECLAVMQSAGHSASADEIMQQVLTISKRSDGQLISTLQDIHAGRATEIDYLNLEIALSSTVIGVRSRRGAGNRKRVGDRLAALITQLRIVGRGEREVSAYPLHH